MPLECGQHGARSETEHAAVPQKIARRHVLGGLLQRRFLYEATHGLGVVSSRHRSALDVTKPRLWHRGPNSEQDDLPLAGQVTRPSDDFREPLLVLNQVISGKHQQRLSLRALLTQQDARRGDGRGGVSTDRFQQKLNVGRCAVAKSCKLLDCLECVLLVRHHNTARNSDCRGAQGRALQQRRAAADLHERLGHGLTRHRPETCAGTAAKNDCPHSRHSLFGRLLVPAVLLSTEDLISCSPVAT